MTQTQTAWNSGKPISSRLPEVYQENEVAEYLTQFWDELLVGTKLKIDDLSRQLNPLECDENWLDFLAPLCGFTEVYWDKTWGAGAKRLLLHNSYSTIWPNKGSKEVLSLVLTCFNIQHLITSRGDFIIGSSSVGDALGTSAWEYIIYLPTIYRNKTQQKLTEKLNILYGPCWCSTEIIFNNSVF